MNRKFWKGWFDRNEISVVKDFGEPQQFKAAKLFLAVARKYAGDFAMIPENLDLDKHIEQFPLTNFKFRKKRGTDVIYSKGGTKFDKDRMAYIIGLMSSIPASNKDSISEDGYVHIYSKYIQDFFPDYKCYLDYLISTGVLISDGFYIEGKKSIGYKFAPAYENTKLVKYVFHRKFQGKEEPSLAVPAQIYNKDTDRLEDNSLVDIPYLSFWYKDKKLTINPGAREYAWQVKERKFASGYSSWDDNHDKWDEKNKRYFKKYPKSQYNAAMHNIAAIASGIARSGADAIVIDGFRGGTGAAPTRIRDNVGIPVELALAAVDERLRQEGIRNDVSLIVSGSIRSSADVIKAIALGADACYIATAALVSLGCHLCRNCQSGKCNWGIATQRPELVARLDPDEGSERLVKLLTAWEREIKEFMGAMGINSIEALKGNRLMLRGIGLSETELKVLGIKHAGE